MNFRGWGVLWLGIPIHNTRYLERTFTLKEDNTKLRCDIHFLGLGCVHEYILLAVRNEPHLCARDPDLDIAEKRSNPTSHPFPFGFIVLHLHKEIENLEFDSLWVTKMKWGDAY